MRRLLWGLAAGAITGGAAHAHIHLTSPLSRIDTEIGNDQKEQHCGVLDQPRNPARVTTILPGATITVTWKETIEHPGYFRIAFQPDDAVFSIPPPGAGGFPDVDLTGMTDAAGALILADQIADGTLSVTERA
jgi:hypothetical protein